LFLEALLLTDVIETLVLFLVIRLWLKIPRPVLSNALLLFAGIYCSATTLPYLWFVLPPLWAGLRLPGFLHSYAAFLVVGESLVFLAEAVFYYFVLKIGVWRSAIVSLVCNATSLVAGLVIF
jgi:hypothetical protein